MAEYIEREKIYADISRFLIDKDSADLTDCEDGWTSAISKAMDVINDVLAADVRPERHGEWLDSESPLTSSCKCSLCSCYFESETPYCPKCGAKMDGGKNNETD